MSAGLQSVPDRIILSREDKALTSENLLSRYGFLFPRSEVAHSASEAAHLASQMGFPVVLKVVSPHIIHKTEVGGEVLSSLSQRQKKPILCGAMGGEDTKRISQAIEAEGVPVYHSIREWMAAAKGLAHRKREKEHGR